MTTAKKSVKQSVKQSVKKPLEGRSLDALIAEKVFGAKWIRFYDAKYWDPDCHDHKVHAMLVLPEDQDFFLKDFSHGKYMYVEDTGECPRDHYDRVPKYSQDIAAAWLVVQALSDRFHAVIRTPFTKDSTICHVGFTPLAASGWNGRADYRVDADSVPKAICYAALAAISGKLSKGN